MEGRILAHQAPRLIPPSTVARNRVHYSMYSNYFNMIKLRLAQILKSKFFDTFRKRLKLDPSSQPELLPIPLLRKYIAYAREYVHPQMNEQAKEEILKFYVELRQTRFSGDSITITHRQLESLVRLTQVILY